jgi:Flp pilus assembly secretin CpaC
MRRTLFVAIALCTAAPAYAAGVSVAMDEVRTITFPKTVATIYVGNPAVADINMIDSRHAFILGKGYGNTNMLALDQDGKQVSTYSCTAAHCEATPQPGDGKDAFDSANGQIAAHSATAKTAANN